MKAAEERQRVEYIQEKREAGIKLTQAEEAILAYSPFGTAGGCSSCAHAGPKPTRLGLGDAPGEN